MPIDVDWLYEKRVLKVRHHGKITAAQLIASMEQTAEMTRQGQSPVHSIIDSRDSEGSPDVGIGDLRKLIPTVPEGTGMLVVIQNGAMDRFLTALGMQIAGARYKFAQDEAAALKILLEHDPSLQNIVR